MLFIIPVESIQHNKGGVILYDSDTNKIIKEYVHNRKWKRVGWRGGCLYGDYLIATDWNQLHYFNYKKWEYEKSFTKQTFNDLHYLKIKDNNLYVVNTGLDAIEIFNNPLNPEFYKFQFVFENTSNIFNKQDININKDYSNTYKISPHVCHPNCIEFIGNKTFVTCFRKGRNNNTGEVIVLESGQKLFTKNFDCHDGNLYKGDYYLTRTRHATILIYKKILERNLPIQEPDQILKIKAKCWWRGMVIKNDIVYLFGSDGYKHSGKYQPLLCTYNLKNKKHKVKPLPIFSDVVWDTVYQPSIYEENI